jgi:Domain of unknown function (DUF3850)
MFFTEAFAEAKMVEHTLKTLPDYWDAIDRGEKTFEVRRDDRGFQKGDVLRLLRLVKIGSGPHAGVWVEEKSDDGYYVELHRKISYVLTGGQFGIEPGYVVLGLKK